MLLPSWSLLPEFFTLIPFAFLRLSHHQKRSPYLCHMKYMTGQCEVFQISLNTKNILLRYIYLMEEIQGEEVFLKGKALKGCSVSQVEKP